MRTAFRAPIPSRAWACSRVAIELTLVGFGDDRPAAFADGRRIHLDLDTPTTPGAVLRAAGITEAEGLILMNTASVIPTREWDRPVIEDNDQLTLLSAFEGG